MAKPQLTNFPALHQLLRSNHQANTEFNGYVSSLVAPGASANREKEYEAGLEAERIRAKECEARAVRAEAINAKGVRFIRLLGEVIESQHQLSPYVQDVSEKKHYDIRLSPGQIRMALRWYWDVLSSNMEDVLAKGSVVDPVGNNEEP